MKNRQAFWLSCTALAGAIASSPSARADLIVGNMAGINGSRIISSDASTVTWFASAFFTGGLYPPWQVNAVTLGVDSTSSHGADLHAWIYSDDLGVPGTSVLDLGVVHAPEVVPGVRIDISASPLVLERFTQYWVVIRDIDPNAGVTWQTADGGATDAGSQPALSIPGGMVYANGNDILAWSSASLRTGTFVLEGFYVPVPGAVPLIGLACVIGVRRRR